MISFIDLQKENYNNNEFQRRSKDYEDYEWEKNMRFECNLKCNLQKGKL